MGTQANCRIGVESVLPGVIGLGGASLVFWLA